VAVTANQANGAPEVPPGDTFSFYDPDGDADNRRMPLATVVHNDDEGFDEQTELGRPACPA
jgi:hypothetical protein